MTSTMKIPRVPVSSKEIDRAIKRGRISAQHPSRPIAVTFDASTDSIVVTLKNGVRVFFPRRILQGLHIVSQTEAAKVELWPGGETLHWESLDLDLHVPSLLMGSFGNPAWMRELARVGGRATSKAKAAAARRNGRKGGRPKRHRARAARSGS